MRALNCIFLINTGIFCLFFTNNVFAEKTCNVKVQLRQVLLKEGFHRNLTYEVILSSDNKEHDWMYNNCVITLDQRLPPGVFANPDELEDLRRYSKLHVLMMHNRINVELPTEQSEHSNVYIFGKLDNDSLYLWVPLHARYHRPAAGGGYARNEIGPPRVYLRCPDQRLDQCGDPPSMDLMFLCQGGSNEKCSSKELNFAMLSDTLIWEVPVGDSDHYYAVAIGTASVVLAGALYLLQVAHEYRTRGVKV